MTQGNSAPASSSISKWQVIIPVITAFLSLVGTLGVAYMGMIPNLHKTSPPQESQVGTSRASSQAPHVQLFWFANEAPISAEAFALRAKEALNRGKFTGIEDKGDFVFGYNIDYVGGVIHVSSGAVVFVVSGPDWQRAQTMVENLKRGF